MWPNPHETADLDTFTEEILFGKLHFLCSGKFDVNNLSLHSLQSLLLLFRDKRDDFANENEKIYNPTIKKVLTSISDVLYKFFGGGEQDRDIYPEPKKLLFQRQINCDMGGVFLVYG